MFDEDTENEDSPLSMAGEEDETPQVAGLTQLSTEQFAPDEGYRRIIKANEEARNFSKQLQEQYLALMDKATKKLLAKPTKLTGRERLDMILETLSKRPTDTSDPRFFERKNIGTFFRDIGEAGTAMSKTERERIEKRDADLQALEEMKLKFLMPRAEKTEEQTRQELIREEQRRARAAGGSKGYELPYLQDMRSRLIQERSALDPRDPRFLDLNKRIEELDTRIEYLGGQRGTGAEKPTVGQAAIDKKFGEEYAAWTLGGGVQSAARIAKINDVASQLQSREDMSGPIVGYALENLPTVASVIYPEAQDAKDVVESVVQTDLRAILGGQFAAREGEALIKRAYNPRLKEEQNIRRLQLLSMQMQKVADEKNRAMTYFGEKGTIKGYNFVPYRATDFLTSDQLKRLDAGESVESILGEKSASEREPASTGTQSSASVPDFVERAKREQEKREQEKRNRERSGRQ